MDAAAASVSARFFGLRAESATPSTNALGALNWSTAATHFGSVRFLALGRSLAPLARRHGEERHAEQQRHRARRGRRRAVGLVGAARNDQHDIADDEQTQHPTHGERGSVRSRPGRAEHEDHRNDRYRAQSHTDR